MFVKYNVHSLNWLKSSIPRLLIKTFIYSFPPPSAHLPHFPWNSCYNFYQSFDIEKLFGYQNEYM